MNEKDQGDQYNINSVYKTFECLKRMHPYLEDLSFQNIVRNKSEISEMVFRIY
jgi:hypothetical protein